MSGLFTGLAGARAGYLKGQTEGDQLNAAKREALAKAMLEQNEFKLKQTIADNTKTYQTGELAAKAADLGERTTNDVASRKHNDESLNETKRHNVVDESHTKGDHFTFVPGVDPATHEPTVFAGNTGTGTMKSTGVERVPAGGSGSGGALMIASMNRLGMSENDIKSAITEMEQFENDPRQRAKLTPMQRGLGAASTVKPNDEAHGLGGVLSNAAGATLTGGAQSVMDKDYARYLYNKERVGTALTEILPRPNQALLGIEKGLSGIDVNWSPGNLAAVQQRRRNALANIHSALVATQNAVQGGSRGSNRNAPADAGTPAPKGKTFSYGGVTYEVP